jgi:hypothetical protein
MIIYHISVWSQIGACTLGVCNGAINLWTRKNCRLFPPISLPLLTDRCKSIQVWQYEYCGYNLYERKITFIHSTVNESSHMSLCGCWSINVIISLYNLFASSISCRCNWWIVKNWFIGSNLSLFNKFRIQFQGYK